MEPTTVQMGGGEMSTAHHTDGIIIHGLELSRFDLSFDWEPSCLFKMTIARGRGSILFVNAFADHRYLFRGSSFP